MRKKKYSKELKAKVAIEALRGEKTVQEIAQIYKIHPNMVTQWKKQLLEGASAIFEKGNRHPEGDDSGKKIDELYNQIGMLQVEKEFLKKKHKQLFGYVPEL